MDFASCCVFISFEFSLYAWEKIQPSPTPEAPAPSPAPPQQPASAPGPSPAQTQPPQPQPSPTAPQPRFPAHSQNQNFKSKNKTRSTHAQNVSLKTPDPSHATSPASQTCPRKCEIKSKKRNFRSKRFGQNFRSKPRTQTLYNFYKPEAPLLPKSLALNSLSSVLNAPPRTATLNHRVVRV